MSVGPFVPEDNGGADAKGRARKTSHDGGNAALVLPPPSAPMAVARAFTVAHYTCQDALTLRHWRGSFWRWETSRWCELENRVVLSLLYAFTEDAYYIANKTAVPWGPNRHKIGDLLEALAAICILPSTVDQPCWLDDTGTGVIVAVNNGLLDVERRQLIPHTPHFFNQTAVPFDYDPEAPEPKCWGDFLDALWPDEPQAIDVLSEWFGYVVSGRLDLHKILLMVGPTRGGKGVIARILTALIGPKNVAGPTLNSLGGEFGLAPLIGKPLAIISDARFVNRNGGIVVERLLSISGEDALTVNRKYRDQWTGKLPSRLHVISNELPRLGDASTAIVGRIVLLPLTRSWLGKEDHALEQSLHSELGGILNWALAGLERLTVANDNCFTRLPAAEEAIITMRDLASPVAAFVREKCEVGASYEVNVDLLYASHKTWCEDNEHPKASKQIFGRDLRAAVPSVRKVRPRDDERSRHHVYSGIRLTPASGHSGHGDQLL